MVKGRLYAQRGLSSPLGTDTSLRKVTPLLPDITDERLDRSRRNSRISPMVRDLCAKRCPPSLHPFHCWDTFRTSRIPDFLPVMRESGGYMRESWPCCTPPVSLAESRNLCYSSSSKSSLFPVLKGFPELKWTISCTSRNQQFWHFLLNPGAMAGVILPFWREFHSV